MLVRFLTHFAVGKKYFYMIEPIFILSVSDTFTWILQTINLIFDDF